MESQCHQCKSRKMGLWLDRCAKRFGTESGNYFAAAKSLWRVLVLYFIAGNGFYHCTENCSHVFWWEILGAHWMWGCRRDNYFTVPSFIFSIGWVSGVLFCLAKYWIIRAKCPTCMFSTVSVDFPMVIWSTYICFWTKASAQGHYVRC